MIEIKDSPRSEIHHQHMNFETVGECKQRFLLLYICSFLHTFFFQIGSFLAIKLQVLLYTKVIVMLYLMGL